jgi:hypothetical protein
VKEIYHTRVPVDRGDGVEGDLSVHTVAMLDAWLSAKAKEKGAG